MDCEACTVISISHFLYAVNVSKRIKDSSYGELIYQYCVWKCDHFIVLKQKMEVAFAISV